jgi:hypothetical protein
MIQLRQYPTELHRIPDGFVLVHRRRLLHYPEGHRLGIHAEGWVFHESEMGIGPMFSGQPIGQITAEGMRLLATYLPQADFMNLPRISYDRQFEAFCHPFLDRWYVHNGDDWDVVMLENDIQPPGITFLSNLVQKIWVDYGVRE